MTSKLAEMTASILKAQSHPIRVKILDALCTTDEICVCDMNEFLESEQSNISQHLKVLRDAGLITFRKEGLRALYRVKHPEVKDILDAVRNIIKAQVIEISEEL